MSFIRGRRATSPILIAFITLLVAFSPIMSIRANASAQTMRRALTASGESIDSYWTDLFAAQGFDYVTPELAFESGDFDTSCEGDASFAAYCGNDETIYLDSGAIDEYTGQIGDLLPDVILAHEWGHHLTMLLLPYDGDEVDLSWIDKDWEIEVLADCLSGVYIGHLWYGFATEDGELTEAISFMAEIGDPTHGSGDDRIVGFMHGFVDGLSGCDVLA